MRLAIFDFDGTITTKDSFLDFIIFTHGKLHTLVGAIVLSPALTLFSLKLLSNSRTKEFVVTHFYRGWEGRKLKIVAAAYAKDALPRIVKKSALERLTWHKQQGHRVIVVSASPEFYLEDWCASQKVELLATKIEYDAQNRVTGKLEGKNCHGDEKVRRIREALNLADFEYIYAYGDSSGDKPLAKIANEFHYRNFK